MKKLLVMLCVVTLVISFTKTGHAYSILLDADSVATGSTLNPGPLVTPYGSITFDGEIIDRDGDLEFNAAGAYGNVFDVLGSNSYVQMDFTMDPGYNITDVTFIYGGNAGSIQVEALYEGAVVDSFSQGDTGASQPAGPETLSAAAIDTLRWKDKTKKDQFAPLDNIEITVAGVTPIPEPATFFLFGAGLIVIVGIGRKTFPKK